MLSDFITSLTTSCSPYVRGMGYLEESLAMRRRYRRRAAAWASHLENTRRFVLSSAQQCGNKHSVAVIGSGHLLDVPLAELAASFEKVLLTDVVCLPEVRKEIKKYPNVSFAEKDITGIAEELYRRKLSGSHELPEVKIPAAQQFEQYGLVVSLNILSQLWVIPRAYAVKPRPEAGPEQLDDWCGRIVAAHYAFLQSLTCPVCLIADYEFAKYDGKGTLISRASTVFGLTLPEPGTSWTWKIGPLGEESDYYSKELRVGAWFRE